MESKVDGSRCRHSAAADAPPREREADEVEAEEGHLGEVRVEGAAQPGVETVHHAVGALEPAPGHTREVDLAGRDGDGDEGGRWRWTELLVIPEWPGMDMRQRMICGNCGVHSHRHACMHA